MFRCRKFKNDHLPPGFNTRHISANPNSRCSKLRTPKATVTASKVFESKERILAIAKLKIKLVGQAFCFRFLPCHGMHIFWNVGPDPLVSLHVSTLRSENRRAASYIQHQIFRSGPDNFHRLPTPAFINTHWQQVIQQIVFRGDPVKHLLYLFFFSHDFILLFRGRK